MGRSDNPDCLLDPATIDAATDTCNPLRYIPSIALNATGVALYGTAAAITIYYQIRYRKLGLWFMVLPISVACEAIGLALRIWLRTNVHSLGGYIVTNMFVILSPCGLLAADYVLLGRLVRWLNADRYLFIRPEKVSTIFIISDVVTFLIQATGGGMSAMASMAKIGPKIFLVGLAAQLGSFILFTFMWLVFLIRARRDTVVWNHPGWKGLYFALGWTCIFFIVRSCFRVVELSQGYVGYLATHEAFVFGLDTIPLWIGLVVYCWYWPPKILTAETAIPKVTHDYQMNGPDSPGRVHNLDDKY